MFLIILVYMLKIYYSYCERVEFLSSCKATDNFFKWKIVRETELRKGLLVCFENGMVNFPPQCKCKSWWSLFISHENENKNYLDEVLETKKSFTLDKSVGMMEKNWKKEVFFWLSRWTQLLVFDFNMLPWCFYRRFCLPGIAKFACYLEIVRKSIGGVLR